MGRSNREPQAILSIRVFVEPSEGEDEHSVPRFGKLACYMVEAQRRFDSNAMMMGWSVAIDLQFRPFQQTERSSLALSLTSLHVECCLIDAVDD